MIKKILIIIIVLLSCHRSFAAALEANSSLAQRLTKLCATYEAKVGVAFIDLRSGEEFAINGDQPFMAASVAKVPVMAAAFHLSDLGRYDLQQKLVFREEDKLGGSGILQWLRGGTAYTRWNLSRMMIVLSDNTATRLLVNDLGLPAVNGYIKTIGLRQTEIVDPTMLNEPPATELNLTTPLDMAHLFALIAKSQNFSAQAKKEMASFLKNQRYRWGIWRGVPAGVVVADKTGNVGGVLNDAGIVYTKHGNYVLSVFTIGFKKQHDARILINQVSRAAYEEFTGEKVYDPKPVKRKLIRKKVIIKRRSPRRPSAPSLRRKGRSGRALNRKLRSALPR
jgi:beta-lactamase class A